MRPGDFIEKYAAGSGKNILEAYNNAMGDYYSHGERPNLWKYGANRTLVPVDFLESSPETVMKEMLKGTVMVVPGKSYKDDPDFTDVKTITAVKYDGKYYVNVMNASDVRRAWENRPTAEVPSFLERLLDFFCRLVGQRRRVCAVWDDQNQISGYLKNLEKVEKIESKKEKFVFQARLANKKFDRDNDYEDRGEVSYDDSEYEDSVKKLFEERTNSNKNYDSDLLEWYMALYDKYLGVFPTYIPLKSEIDMARMDQNALTFAKDKIKYKAYGEEDSYTRKAEMDDEFKRFDVRAAIVTTLAFGHPATSDWSTEDIFDLLAGKDMPNADAIRTKMDELMKKISDPATHDEVRIYIDRGTRMMCRHLVSQDNLRSGISYQLGRMIQRNMFAFGSGNNGIDIQVNLDIDPLAKQISEIQNEIIDSYTPSVLQGFALHEFKEAKEVNRKVAPVILPLNAVGHTNAAFLDRLSDQAPGCRQAFIDCHFPLLKDMNENLKNFVAQRASEEHCVWLEDPDSLQEALNGGMVREYQRVIMDGFTKENKIPEFKNKPDPNREQNEKTYRNYEGREPKKDDFSQRKV